jgi:dTDP-4-amino-4,6-dideoxygalactose transaminase
MPATRSPIRPEPGQQLDPSVAVSYGCSLQAGAHSIRKFRKLRHHDATARAALAARAFRPPSGPPDTVVPIYRSTLPTAKQLLPYLKMIDANRWYTNRGELVYRLEQRLSALFGGRTDAVVTASSGTSAIEAAILATAGRATGDRPFALVPAYTFVATAFAAQSCGYTPYFVDVDPDSWMLDPGGLFGHPVLEQTGVVIPVAAYGRSVLQAPWQHFRDRTGIPVVIDAAAAVEAMIADPGGMIGPIPVTLSFQATKALSVGEGGAVVWSEVAGLARVVSALNFGFRRSRASEGPGLNGKMSEYHAAVGLASLDEWDAKLAANRRVSEAYRQAAAAQGFADTIAVSPEIGSNYALFIAPTQALASAVVDELTANRIEHRLWYGNGLHKQPYFASAPSDRLPVTDDLAPRLVALPCFEDLPSDAVQHVVACLGRVLSTDRR